MQIEDFFNPAAALRDWRDGDYFRVADALTGVCVFGATGSGKTSGPAKFIAHAYLSAGFGGVILTAKIEERNQWIEWAEKCNRLHDLRIVDVTGDQRFNFLEWEAARQEEGGGLTINIVALLGEIAKAIKGSEGGGGGDAKFFEDALHHMNTNLVDLVVFSGLSLSLPLMRDIVLSAPQTLDEAQSEKWKDSSVCAAVLAEAADKVAERDNEGEKADFAECRAYWTNEFPTVSFKTRSIITLMFSMLTRPFTTRPLRRLFCEDITITPEDTFDGKIILIDLPVQEFRLAGRVAALAWKFCFQVAVMRRQPPQPGPEGEKTYHRPVFLWADEAQNFITDQDAEYQAVARSAGGCTVYLTQNRESYRRVLGNDDTVDALLGNLQCKIFCQNSSPGTNEWAAKLLGERYVYIDSEGTSFSTQDASGSRSENTSEERRFYVQPSEFATLRRGGAVNDLYVEALVYNGGYQFLDPDTAEPMPYKFLKFDQLETALRQEREAERTGGNAN